MSDRLLQEDTRARNLALEPRSFIVEAPAGAGKTELLTQRALSLLARVEAPEEVVALTFTNKAATEMRDRILGSLELAAAGRRPGDDQPHRQHTFDLGRRALARDAECQWQLLRHPGRLAVTTIDALCAGLARQMPLLSRFGAQPGVAEDAAPHYRQAARRTLAMVEDDGADAEVVARALRFLDNDAGRLEALLVAMLGRRDQWLPHLGRADGGALRGEAEAGLAALVLRDLEAAATALPGRLQERFMGPARFAAATLMADDPAAAISPLASWTAPLAADLAHLPHWRALADLLLTATGSRRKTVNKHCGFPPAAKEPKAAFLAALDEVGSAAEEALARLRQSPDPTLGDDDWATVENFSRLLTLAVAQLWLVFQEAGEVDFAEIAQRAVRALGDEQAPTDLALALDYRIRHLLVDEFQDTSPAQVRLIAGLTRGWQEGDGRSLFLVGDPMQSIYRFRKADVGLFLKVRDQGIGDLQPTRLRLFRNNRSAPHLVDWVNQAFPAIFPPADDPLYGAVAYTAAVPTRPAEAAAGAFFHPLLPGPDADGPRGEARCLLDLITAARRHRPDGSIAVLVRARRHLDGLVAELRRRAPELAFQAVETESLAGRQPIVDLLALASALLHRGDRVHWLAILRAPWCGLTLADLHALAAADHRATIWQLLADEAVLAGLSADGRRRALRLRGVLARALAEQGRQHPRRWIEGTWQLLGGPDCLADAAAAADVAALFQLMDQLVGQGRFSAETLAEEATALYAPADPTPAAGRLQLMTIHKAKGLEFDTVLLPGLHRGGGKDDPALLLWDEIPADGPREHLVVAPINRRRAASGRPSAYDALARLERERAAHERERLLYVAATRARHTLHLIGSTGQADDGSPKPPRSGTLLQLLWPAGGAQAFAEAAAGAPADAAPAPDIDPATFVPQLLRLPGAALPPLPELPDVAPGAAAAPAAPEGTTADALAPDLDAAVGTLIHRCLQLIADAGPDAWPTSRIAGLAGAYRAWLRSNGQANAAAAAGADRVVAALVRTLESPTGRWLLAAHRDGGSELALSARDGDGVVHHRVDRSFVADGCRWIIDFKTVHGDDDPLRLQRKAAEYRDQLERYGTLFVGEGLPRRLAVYFVAQDRLVELPPAPEPPP